APAVELEAHRDVPAGAADDDRAGVAQPDVAERLVKYGGGRGRLPCRSDRFRAFGDEPDLFALALGPDGAGKGGGLGARRLEIRAPIFLMARKADPDEGVGSPFGGLARGQV